LQVVLLLVSFSGFSVVMRAIMDMFAGAMAESATDGTSRQLLGRMLALTLAVWSLFPLVWLLGRAGLVSLTVEQVGGLLAATTRSNRLQGCTWHVPVVARVFASFVRVANVHVHVRLANAAVNCRQEMKHVSSNCADARVDVHLRMRAWAQVKHCSQLL
jgi:hypothetical protein